VDDFAALAVEEGRAEGNRMVDAIGPETFTYRELVCRLGQAIGVERPIVSVPASAAYLTARLVGIVTGDVLITRDEIRGLMAGLLCTDSPPVGETSLIAWAEANVDHIGHRYASEVARRKDRQTSFRNL
jgi:NADH dehydrogenase